MAYILRLALQVTHQNISIATCLAKLKVVQSARLDHDRQRNEEPGTLGVSRHISSRRPLNLQFSLRVYQRLLCSAVRPSITRIADRGPFVAVLERTMMRSLGRSSS